MPVVGGGVPVVGGGMPVVAGRVAPGLVGVAPPGGGAACTTTASDEAKARMETREAVEMAYIILKETLGERVVGLIGGNSPSFYTCVEPELFE